MCRAPGQVPRLTWKWVGEPDCREHPLGGDETRADSVTRDDSSQCNNATMQSAFALLAFVLLPFEHTCLCFHNQCNHVCTVGDTVYTKVGKILIKLKMRKINILSYPCQSRSKFEINASLDVKFDARLVFLFLTNCCFLRQRFGARSQWSFKPRVLLTWNTFWDLSLTHFKGWFVLQVVSTNTFVANKFPSVWTNLQKHPALQRCKPQGGIALPF